MKVQEFSTDFLGFCRFICLYCIEFHRKIFFFCLKVRILDPNYNNLVKFLGKLVV